MGVPAELIQRYRYEVEGWGVGEIDVSGETLVAHELPTDALSVSAWYRDQAPNLGPAPHRGGARPPEFTLAARETRVCASFVSDLIGRFRRHLAGLPTSYDDIQLELAWCTPFQLELARALLAVPWGEIVSYGELAALAGRPGAARAAGSFCARSPFSLVFPCHRVVGATGIGSYGESGLPLKRRLLALEGVDL